MSNGFLYLGGRGACVILPSRQRDEENGILQLKIVESFTLAVSKGSELVGRPKGREI